MADADARATARRHTARLLKMLRGYGPAADPEEPASEPSPVPEPAATALPTTAVAEAAPAYDRRVTAFSSWPSTSPATRAAPSLPHGRKESSAMPRVGEMLRQPPGVLGQLMARANRLSQLNQVFHAYLPPYLRDHATLIRLDAEGWEVQTDSASWATRLRYALPTIRQALGQQVGITLPKPRIRVTPAAVPAKPRRPPLKLTQRSAELLEMTACKLKDPALGAALRRLAAHGRPKAGPET